MAWGNEKIYLSPSPTPNATLEGGKNPKGGRQIKKGWLGRLGSISLDI